MYFNYIMSLTNIEIEDICKFYDLPLNGIYMNDLMDNQTPKQGLYIMNLDMSTGSGNHWTCIYVNKKTCVYFDSFGAPSPSNAKIFMRKLCKQNYYNANIIQDLRSSLCGWYCIGLALYIKHYFNNNLTTTVNDYINYFDDNTKKNCKILQTMFLQYKPVCPLVKSILLKQSV